MKTGFRSHPLIRSAIAVVISVACVSTLTLAGCRQGDSKNSDPVGQPLTVDQAKTVRDAADLMASHGLNDDASLAKHLLDQHIWMAATDHDKYLTASEKAGYTPYAYTLSDGKHPSAIVLAPRFFTETTRTGQAALMIHELGHYKAYVATGKSDETDGYKVEYDTHKKLGLSESDSLVYFSMLDGVEEYVVPKYPQYKNYPDVKQYMTQ